jgi:protein-disulfide isomerase-like protein with CxxC motif
LETEETLKVQHHVRFVFDPVCPWAWRASQWIRAARRLRPLSIEWGLLSLSYLNREHKDAAYLERLRKGDQALRLLAKTRSVAGEEGIDCLYQAIGEAHHQGGLDLDDHSVLERALSSCHLPTRLLSEAREDKLLDQELNASYKRMGAGGAFGVPTIYVDHSEVPYFGPVIARIPMDEEAADLWDHILGLTHHSYFCELKRPRGR